ncbi:MAG: CBS domain-containing protein [Verrucomicrobiota bacterium]
MKVSGTISAILKGKKSDIWTIHPDATVYEAIKMMAEKNIGAVLVTENNRLVGVISERDYTRKVMLKGKTSRETKVREIFTTAPLTISPNDSVDGAMREMSAHRVRHLPVVEGETIVGIVSIGDLVNWTITAQDVTIDQLQNYIHGNPA